MSNVVVPTITCLSKTVPGVAVLGDIDKHPTKHFDVIAQFHRDKKTTPAIL